DLVAAQMRVIAVGQHIDKLICVRKPCRSKYFLVRRVKLSVPDILHDRSDKQMRILKHDSERPAQICLLDLVDVDAVIADLTVLHIIEAVNQVCNRSLSSSRGTYKCQLLSRLCVQRQIMKHHLAFRISKGHIKETHIAFQLCISHASVRLMR